MALASNHPKPGDVPSFNNALCGLYASGLGAGVEPPRREAAALRAGATAQPRFPARPPAARAATSPPVAAGAPAPGGDGLDEATYGDLGRLFAEFLERGRELMGAPATGGPRRTEPVVITGAALGLPGAERLFDDANIVRLLGGQQGIDVIPGRLRREMLDKHITRLVKGDDGGATFETIDRPEDVIKLAGRAGAFDIVEEFGVDADRVAALGRDTQLAIAAGIDALRDAGIPLVRHYKTTTVGSKLPDRWGLPGVLRDDTGVIFASAFPGLEEMTDEVARQTEDRMRRERLAALDSLRDRMLDHEHHDPVTLGEVERRIHEVSRCRSSSEAYTFDRRFLFRVLSMGHSQFAELIGARGPNTQVNAACASTTQAVAVAEDWIRVGRCRRVVVVAADDATSDTMLGWLGAGFLASGAAATDEVVEEAALPFDRRRHGMILGMGAAALVVESAEAARERGITPICEVLGVGHRQLARSTARASTWSTSAGSWSSSSPRPRRAGCAAHEIAPEMLFVSHETYTPARGGSAAAEIHALRQVFGDDAEHIVIANTKGYTGHPMGVGLEDVVAVKALETGIVPPVPNFRDPDPELGHLNLSTGGLYPVRYALRLAAGFGSQISMLLLRWTPVRRRPAAQPRGARLRLPDRRPRGLDGVAAERERLRRAEARGRPAPPARRRPGSGGHVRGARARRAARRAGGRRGAPPRRSRPAVAPAPSLPPGVSAGAGAGRGADRLPRGPARHGPRPRGRPGDRHGEAGRGVRRDPRGLRDRARRQAQAARLPDLNHVVGFVHERRRSRPPARRPRPPSGRRRSLRRRRR